MFNQRTLSFFASRTRVWSRGGILILCAVLAGCVSTRYSGELGYREDGTFLVPEMGFRGVAFTTPEGTRYAPERATLAADDAFLVHEFTETLMGDSDMEAIFSAPLYFTGDDWDVLIYPGFFGDLVDLDGRFRIYPSYPAIFASIPRDRREEFLVFSFLGYSRTVIKERGWTYAADTSAANTTFLRVTGEGAAATSNDERFELRMVLGRSLEYFFVVARSGTLPPEALKDRLDGWMDSLDFHPDDPAKE